MKLIGFLHHLDQDVTLALNSLHTPFTDAVWMLFSDKQIWYLMYLALAVLMFTRMSWKKALIVILSLALTVAACDQFSNLIKYSVARLRPVWDNYMVAGGLHRLEGKGNFYGFFSAHAANAFGAVTCALMGFRSADRKRSYGKMARLLFTWASLVGISRVFAGKHFLGDVLVGTAAGLLIGFLIGRGVRWIIDKYYVYL